MPRLYQWRFYVTDDLLGEWCPVSQRCGCSVSCVLCITMRSVVSICCHCAGNREEEKSWNYFFSWDYNYTTLLSFPSSKLSQILLVFFKIHPFSLIVVKYMYAYVYTYTFLNSYCSIWMSLIKLMLETFCELGLDNLKS